MIHNEKTQSRRTFLFNLGIIGTAHISATIFRLRFSFSASNKSIRKAITGKDSVRANVKGQPTSGWDMVPQILARIKLPIFPAQNVYLKNINIKKAKIATNLEYVTGVVCDNVVINGQKLETPNRFIIDK